jgi:hypothetical protein
MARIVCNRGSDEIRGVNERTPGILDGGSLEKTAEDAKKEPKGEYARVI